MQLSSIMVEEAQDPASQDRQAVAAVRQGDAGRYRELVERHERRVYAVAWSRLGDATMAEEATQEAFVRGYRHLALLGDGAKFSAWIGTIVRNAAISLGLRQRRELSNRARWALEQPVATEPPEDAGEMAQTSETLRQALADLPAAHRECLVLFYLEGKSGAEAAAALGISETALRVRLHRARGELRERMEARLGESLEQLRPSRTLAPSVMAVVMSGSTAKVGGGAGFGATLAAAVAKVLPFKLAAMFIPVAGMVPVLGFSWWLNREERRNYRDAEGFRAKLHWKVSRGHIWYFAMFALMFFVMQRATHHLDINEVFLALGAVNLVMVVSMIRLLALNRTAYQVGAFLFMFTMGASVFSTGAGWLSMQACSILIFLTSLIIIFLSRRRPMRMDYNLFLRATQGLLPNSSASGEAGDAAVSLNRTELFAFARFLGERYLAVNYRWENDGLKLCLPAVSGMALAGLARMAYLRWSKWSWMMLGANGRVRVYCRHNDEEALVGLGGPCGMRGAELETQVAGAVEQAWRAFRAGDVAAAERALGQVPEDEVFVVPTLQSRAARWRKGMFVVFGVFLVGSLLFGWWSNTRIQANAAKPASADITKTP